MKPKARKSGRTERQRRRDAPAPPKPPPLTAANPDGGGPSESEVLAGRIGLNPGQMEVAVWFFYDGLTMPEIADLLGSTKQAVEDRIRRIEERITRAGMPLPRRLEHPYAQDRVGPTDFNEA